MTWTSSNPVTIRNATKKSDYDAAFDNSQYLRDSVGDFSILPLGTGAGGSVTAPAVSFRDDLNTGMYRISTDRLGFTCGGVKQVDISTSAITLTNALDIASGGSGQVTANAALNAFLPSQASKQNLFLKSDDTNSSWGNAVVPGVITGLFMESNSVSPNTKIDVVYKFVSPYHVSADKSIILRDGSGTVDIAVSGANGLDAGSVEDADAFYDILAIAKEDGTKALLLKRKTIKGVATSTTANKLVASGETFQTDNVAIGDEIINTNTFAKATVTAIDSQTQLSLSSDIFTLGHQFVLELKRAPTMPTDYVYTLRLGSIYNDASYHFQYTVFNENNITLTGGLPTFGSHQLSLYTRQSWIPNSVPPTSRILKTGLAAEIAGGTYYVSYDGTNCMGSWVLPLDANFRFPALIQLDGSRIYYTKGTTSGSPAYYQYPLGWHDIIGQRY